MRTDTVLRNEGMRMLINNLGMVEAERFIMLIQREPFDYSKWQENLFEDMSIEEISKNAASIRKKIDSPTFNPPNSSDPDNCCSASTSNLSIATN